MCKAERRDRVGAAGFSESCFSESHREPVAGPAERLATGSPRGGQAIAILHPPELIRGLRHAECKFQSHSSLGSGLPGNSGHPPPPSLFSIPS